MKKTLLLFAIILTISGISLAQNTQREPLGGTTTNPYTPTEVPDPNVDPLTGETVRKKKPKGKVAPAPTESTEPASKKPDSTVP